MVQDNALDTTLSALSDPTRRQIVQRLMISDATISELAEPHDMSMPAVMKHVGKLVDAGLVSRSKSGRVVTCSLNIAPIDDAHRWLGDMLTYWNTRMDALDEYLARHHEEDEQ